MTTILWEHGQTRAAANWERQMAAVERFAERMGRIPRANCRRRSEKPLESRLADWLRRQRRNSENLSLQQCARLEALPGFEWEPRDAAWDDQLFAYRSFLQLHGRPPRRRSEDAHERSLAIWFRNQRTRLARGTLPKHRADDLRSLGL